MNENNLTPKFSGQKWKILSGIFAALLVAAVAALVYVVKLNNASRVSNSINGNILIPLPFSDRSNINSLQQGQNPNFQQTQVKPPQPPGAPEQVPTTYVPKAPGETWLKVNWASGAVKVKCQDGLDYAACYQVGTITQGQWAGRPLILQVVKELGSSLYYYALEKSGQFSAEFSAQNIKLFGIDDAPEKLDLPGTGYSLSKGYRQIMFSEAKIKFKLFDHPFFGPVYLMDNGCIMAELPDHTALAYNLDLPFVNASDNSVDFTFFSGKKNTENYQFNAITGCGALCYYLAVVEDAALKPQERLEPVGKTLNGDDIWQLRDSTDPALKNLYNDKNTVAFMADGTYENTGKSKYSYSQFLSYKPLLYWKDPLGRWIEFKNQRFIAAAEMCKPVIYLYPEKPTQLTVKVNPSGGFTFTNPKYNNGWKVLAYPNGRVTNLADGKTYPYLFWEGVGLNFPLSDDGWVVSPKELSEFFNSQLPKLGLKGREIVDFKDYWVKRLAEAPYYRLNFLKQEQFNEIAPLSFEGNQPVSFIRVFMTAKPLTKAEPSRPQDLPAPQPRVGFTLAEWGGAVLR